MQNRHSHKILRTPWQSMDVGAARRVIGDEIRGALANSQSVEVQMPRSVYGAYIRTIYHENRAEIEALGGMANTLRGTNPSFWERLRGVKPIVIFDVRRVGPPPPGTDVGTWIMSQAIDGTGPLLIFQ